MPSKDREPKFRYRFTDTEAVAKIKKLPKRHRAIIGRVVWWDWFASRLSCDRTNRFDKWLNVSDPNEPDYKVLIKSLVQIGYPEYFAERRLKPKFQPKPRKTKNDKANNNN